MSEIRNYLFANPIYICIAYSRFNLFVEHNLYPKYIYI